MRLNKKVEKVEKVEGVEEEGQSFFPDQTGRARAFPTPRGSFLSSTLNPEP
jgi:hypothetical protein